MVSGRPSIQINDMYYVYILKSEKDGSFYTGQCQNLQERLSKHNNGYNRSTKSKRPWMLVYHECLDTRSKAVKRELEIKRKKSRIYIEELISIYCK